MSIDQLTALIVDLCVKIHSRIGPGCFESIYEEVLYYELIKQGIDVERQKILPLTYDNLYLERAYKLDLLVDHRLVVELKSIHPTHPYLFKQMHSQLFLTGLKYGMIVNFNVDLMKNGIHRVFNNTGKERLND